MIQYLIVIALFIGAVGYLITASPKNAKADVEIAAVADLLLKHRNLVINHYDGGVETINSSFSSCFNLIKNYINYR